MLAVSWELLISVVVRAAPLKSTTEDDTKWLPAAVRTKLGCNCAKSSVAGEIEVRAGTGRALPQRGFKALHPGRIKSTTSNETTSTIRTEGSMN